MIRNKWISFAFLYLSAVTLSLSQIKIAPVQENLGLSLSDYTWLMSVFMISALVLALPSGSLISRYGAKRVAVVIMTILVLGNILGGVSTDSEKITNYCMLLFSRVFEGFAFSFIYIIAMVLISDWFKENLSGTAIGIFGTFSGLASMVGMNIYLPIFKYFGLCYIWYFTAALSVIVLLGLIFFTKENQKTRDKEKVIFSYGKIFKNTKTWLLAFSMGCISFVLFTFISFYPRILTDIFGISIVSANTYSGFFGLTGIPFGFLTGVLVDKYNIRPAVLGIISGLFIALGCALIIIPSSIILLQILILTAAINVYTSCVNIYVSKTIKTPEVISKTFAIIYFFYYIGVFTGPPVIVSIVEMTGCWRTGCAVLMCVALAGTVSLLLLAAVYNGKKRR